jgi:hypothetical protein
MLQQNKNTQSKFLNSNEKEQYDLYRSPCPAQQTTIGC